MHKARTALDSKTVGHSIEIFSKPGKIAAGLLPCYRQCPDDCFCANVKVWTVTIDGTIVKCATIVRNSWYSCFVQLTLAPDR